MYVYACKSIPAPWFASGNVFAKKEMKQLKTPTAHHSAHPQALWFVAFVDKPLGDSIPKNGHFRDYQTVKMLENIEKSYVSNDGNPMKCSHREHSITQLFLFFDASLAIHHAWLGAMYKISC